jgi:glycosyltransferase involved in cell wall biosynthesis
VIGSSSFYQQLINLCLQKCDKIIPVSNYTANRISLKFADKINIIQNGFELNIQPVSKIPSVGKLNLITVGTVYRRKGQHNVVKAIPEIRKKGIADITYNLIGIVQQPSLIQEAAENAGVKDTLVFHGALNEKDKLNILPEADIFLMLSEKTPEGNFEGFGIALLEANALGIPTVGSANSGIEDAIQNGYNGILVNPHDPSQVADAVISILQNYAEFSRNAVSFSRSFTWENIIKKYLAILK